MGKAVLLVLLSLLFGAGGGALRYFSDLSAQDASLVPVDANVLSVSLIVLSAFFAVLMAILILWFGPGGVKPPKHLTVKSGVFECFTGVLSGVALGASAYFKYTAAAREAVLSRLDIITCAALAVGAAAVVAAGILLAVKGRGDSYLRLIPVAAICCFLIAVFKQWCTDPVISHYVYRLLAVAFVLLSSYYHAGEAFGFMKPVMTLFFSSLGIYMSFIALADDVGLGYRAFFLFGILYPIMVIIYQIRYLCAARRAIDDELMGR
ncbi:MAG: hypothetical protein IKE62_04005 [Oscillospiraceae bacterium]|nr:hypothetical protein [Oscillospiraceae bacterium]